MGKLSLILSIVLITIVQQNSAKKFDKCELYKLLKDNNISNTEDWICLAENESGLESSKKNPDILNSFSYGIFKINSLLWCGINTIGGYCNRNCSSFLDDDLTDDIKCISQIYKYKGFSSWENSKFICQKDNSKHVSSCLYNKTSAPSFKPNVPTSAPNKVNKVNPAPKKEQIPEFLAQIVKLATANANKFKKNGTQLKPATLLILPKN